MSEVQRRADSISIEVGLEVDPRPHRRAGDREPPDFGLCDVYALPKHRGEGLCVWLLESEMPHPDRQELRTFLRSAAGAQ